MSRGWRRGRLPLPVVALAGAAGTGLLATAATLAAYATVADPVKALVAGLLISMAAGGAAMIGAGRVARALTELRSRITARLADPLRTTTEVTLPGRFAELTDLVGAIDAVCTRAYVADRIAAERQQAAETTAAGMFDLLSGLVQAEEGARGQIAAELHDTVAQTLMLARTVIASAAAPDADTLRYAADLVGEAEDQVRAVMARTRPPALRDGDLARAMRALLADLENRYGLVVSLQWPDEPRPVPIATAVTVYRFFQEALLNVVKHADDDVADARLDIGEDRLVATVSDHGPGFDPAQVKPERGRHVGLGLLRERARLAGGTVEVASTPGKGTTLTLTLALGAGARRAVSTPTMRQLQGAGTR